MLKHIKRLLRDVAQRSGYQVIPTWRFDKMPMASLLREMLEKQRVEVVLDVGANKGQFATFLRSHVGFTGEIISFEPIPENVRYIEFMSSRDDKWKVIATALSDHDGVAPLNVMSESVFSSFLRPNDLSKELFPVWNAIDHTIQCQTRRLEGMLAEIGLDPRKRKVFLKTDTQGHDIAVIDGCGEIIRDIPVVQLEVSVMGIYEGMPTMFESIQRMQSLNYSLCGLFPVTQDKELRVIEFDAFFLNNRFAQDHRS